MDLKLYDHQDVAELWSTFNSQRLLGIGIAALAFAPLVTNAHALWQDSGRLLFLSAIALLGFSIMLAHGSLRAHRALAVHHAIYANLRRQKEGALKITSEGGMTPGWRSAFDEMNQEDKRLAEEAGQHYQRLENWLASQYAAALLGTLAMLVALIQTPPT